MTYLLEMRNISKEFSGVKALDGVTLSVKKGTIHALCGENGAGKSTLMNILSGVYPHGTYKGEILINSKPASFKNISASERAGITIIHQELSLIPELSITENIFLGNETANLGIIKWTEAKKRARQLMLQVGLNEDPDTPIKNLGVGKQQLVEIAKALSKEVKILILDEPTSALNEEDSRHLLSLLCEMRTQGITCLLISHKLSEVLSVSDSVTIIRDGKTIETIHRGEGKDFNEQRIIKGMVGRPLNTRYPDRKAGIGEVFFETKDWTVAHPELPYRTVCKGISFFVRRGEIVGFAGLMGAGRTELALSLFGKSYGIYKKGCITKDGKALALKNPKEAIGAGIAYVTEDRKNLGFNPLESIKRTIVSSALHRISRRCVIDEVKEIKVSEDYCRALSIKASSVNDRVIHLSGGNQQKVILSKWLFTDPDLLVLDEPTRGIDVGAKFEIYNLIHEFAQSGKGVIIISSELPELLGVADRIYVLCNGRITGALDKSEANQERLMELMTAF